ncbi:DUF488 family protein [Bradyrhizobium sp. STM 3566]|uniref:DUF488 domain-containing protein n=1 Tax=Bradyrhizobium sp. STM 3566 TaxID=578928 RepID=UPI00388FD722
MKLFTAGYEGSTPNDLFACLQQSGVKLLIDVRNVPISRKRGFSKTALAAGLASVGIDYLHLKGLGDPKPGRVAAHEGRYTDFRKIFGAHMRTSAAQQALATAVSSASLNLACLLCFERDHTNCHRSIVVESMVGLKSFSVVHLKPSAPSDSIMAKEHIFPRAGAVAHSG